MMDPNETLRLLREAINEGRWFAATEYARAIDEWLTGGGFLPQAWNICPECNRPRRKCKERQS